MPASTTSTFQVDVPPGPTFPYIHRLPTPRPAPPPTAGLRRRPSRPLASKRGAAAAPGSLRATLEPGTRRMRRRTQMTSKDAETSVMSFYSALQTRVDAWLASDEAVSFPPAELYRHPPELYRFLVALALDQRVPEQERTCTLSAIKYVVPPYDLIPEAVVGTPGFRDDLVLAAMMVHRLCEALRPVPVAEHRPADGA